ncbi:MAG: TRAP transporter TatT component family protein [Desulfobacterales bacterium]
MKMKKNMVIVSIAMMAIFLVVVSLTGCGAKRESAYLEPDTAKVVDKAKVNELIKKADAFYEKRAEARSMKEALKTYEKALELDPTNRAVLQKLAIGCYWYAGGHLTDKEAQLEYYNKGAEYGERGMALNPEFKKRVMAGEKDYECLDALGKEDIPSVYWVFANLGRWSNLKGFTTILKNKNKLKAIADWVTYTDEEYYHGAGHRVLGTYYAKAPSFAGGDMNKAKTHFEKSLKLSPKWIGTKTLMAEFYAYKAQDKELFVQLLTDAVNTDVNSIPGAEFEMSVDQKIAKELLAKADDMF